MAKCKLCGKSSLFLKVNLDGICQDCVNNQKNNIIKEIRMVNDYVISFMNNKDLLTICEKFVEKETLYLEALDLIYVPIIAPKILIFLDIIPTCPNINLNILTTSKS